jgi:histidinol-phosphatase (PHP family)
MLKNNYHTHTYRCNHAEGTDEEYVLNAIAGGYHILGFSDHTPWNYSSNFVSDSRMLPEELPNYINSIRELKEKYKAQIDIKIGLECEYFPDYMPWLKEQMAYYELDYVVFGNHYYRSDEVSPYFGVFTTSHEMLDHYEESAIKGMETGIYAYLAHPDLFMASYDEFDEHCVRISKNICQTARRLNMPLEYNLGTAPYQKHLGGHQFPHPSFWKIAKDENCTAIIGVDAHHPKWLHTPIHYDAALSFLNQLGIKITDTIQ